MDYFTKITQKPTPDLTWNIPAQKHGAVNLIGANAQSFRTEIKVAEYLADHYPIEALTLVLPDSLKSKLPPLPNVTYLGSTDSGSFGDETALGSVMDKADYNLLLGDLSKNAITAQVFHHALRSSNRPTLITRDAVDLIAENDPERLLFNEQLVFFASMPQLIKLFRAVYYPKMLLISQSLVQIADALHKFTLSYPTKIITLHSDQVLVAVNGEVKSVALEITGYVPINFWQGELAAKISALNLYNPGNFLGATVAALWPTKPDSH